MSYRPVKLNNRLSLSEYPRDKMKTGERTGQNQHLAELLGIIRFTEDVALRIHGVEDESRIFRIVTEAFTGSSEFASAIILLTDDGAALRLVDVSVDTGALKAGENILKTGVKDIRLPLAKSATFSKVIIEGQTLHCSTAGLISEVLPWPVAQLYVATMDCRDDTTILTPLRRFDKIIGVLAIFSTKLPELSLPSVRNLSAHISSSLEAASRIAGQKQALQALRESEEKFSKAFRSSPDQIAIATLDEGKFIEVNDSFIRNFGYTRQEVIGRKCTDINLWAEPENCRKMVRRLKDAGFISCEEVILKSKSGELRTVLFSAELIHVAGDTCIISVVNDITERKRAEEALRASEEFSTSLMKNSPNPVMVSTMDTAIHYVNPAFEELTGFRAGEAIGCKAPYPWWPEEERVARIEGLKRFHDFPGKLTGQVIRKKNGQDVIVDVSIAGVTLAGDARYYQTHWNDITEHRLAERALQESERKLNSILMSMDDLIFTLDEEGRFVFYRPQRELSASPEQFVGREYREVMPAHIGGLMSEAVAENRAGKTSEFEYWLEIDGCNEYYVAKLSPILSEVGYSGSVGVVSNITGRKVSAEKMERLYEQEKALRTELQTEIEKRVDFTRALVHELKTPLTPVIASSEMMVDALQEEPWLSLAKNIYRGAINLNNRVDELLDVARSELGMLKIQPRWIHPLGMLNSIIDELTLLVAHHSLVLHRDLPSSLPRIWADEVRLRQVVLNLLDNACKYAYEGTEVVLRACCEKGNMVISVSDAGPGLSVSERQKVFQLYYRREKEGQNLSGLGVGLAFCKTIVELHGGSIWVESEEGKGATFSFSIPLRDNGVQVEALKGEKSYES